MLEVFGGVFFLAVVFMVAEYILDKYVEEKED